jgi:methyl-accepting chemotaxis protein
MTFLDRFKIRSKLAILVGLSAVALVAMVVFAATLLHQRMLDDRLAKLRGIVEVTAGFAQSLEDEVVAGKITRDEAFARYRASIHKMWFDNHQNYTYTLQPMGFIVHAANPKLDGSPGTSKDPTASRFRIPCSPSSRTPTKPPTSSTMKSRGRMFRCRS